MRHLISFLSIVTIFISTAAFAEIKPCEQLKAEIEAKLNKKNVKGYKLAIVPVNEVKTQKIVGSCEGGTKNITYSQNSN
ncbi:MAG: DUF1161 domain-containing protein [Candidatus Tectomicrobia bacterium]|uniref:DUF1161 domain-containing protein n=1 Tax=Tectimicrobiota bacterium TaxID=2528274 RepID=A0A933GMS6_UNCTE|nr:DUF1161 domain-containing protein [Candidatus Tectomicrobia bacterium]